MLKKTPLKRVSRLTSKTRLKSTKESKKNFGKKTTQKPIKSKSVDKWKTLRIELYDELASQGITSCELKYENCSGKLFPSLAHSKKRRHIKTDAEMREVIFACVNCHTIIEYSKDMYEIVTDTINRRTHES